MSKQRIDLGSNGEDIAANYLQRKGFEIIARNYKDKLGEIDIIARDRKTLVFVEVKTRRSDRFGLPEEAVTIAKQRQIIRLARSYLVRHQLVDEAARFDVVAIIMKSGRPGITHLVSAFDSD